MIAYEMIETVRNQPTTFQFKRRKNMLTPRTLSGSSRDRVSTMRSTKKRVTKTAVKSENTVPQNSV